MKSYTSGPWKIYAPPALTEAVFITADSIYPKTICRFDGPNRDADSQAVVLLPEMADALRELVELVPAIDCPYSDDPGHLMHGQFPTAVKTARALLSRLEVIE